MTLVLGRDTPETSELPEDSSHNPMVEMRPEDPASLELARARALGALFGQHSASAHFGRFRVLERLGAGGMGVVYAAYDPDLDRGVALKLVNVPIKEREAALTEAKALARLSHPNVVPIYDVGIQDAHVYLVMELVRGKTLRHWIEGRRQREILEAYQQAGAALAAAHAVGLVHRDFKPDNAIVGSDGRVRVVDFGLACEADDPTLDAQRRPAAGTPRFMAPEIAAGAAVTPAADQYSFCVALSDALTAVANEPVPRRIAAVLERGRAGDPRARFESMPHLLRALARDPARTRRRAGVLASLAIVSSTIAFFVGQQAPHTTDKFATCDTGATVLAGAWHPVARAAALARVATLGPYGQQLQPQLAHALETHADHWEVEYRRACVDRLRGVQSDTLTDRRTVCLQRGSDAFARVGELLRVAEPASLADLVRAVQSLPDPTLCSDVRALTSDIAPPPRGLTAAVSSVRARLTRARVDFDAGLYTEARDAAKAAVSDARALDYGPVLAEALLLEGHAQGQMKTAEQDRAAAVPLLTEAYSVAILANADSVAIEAWARRAWARGTTSDPDHALDGIETIEPLAQRNSSGTFAHALLYNNVGTVELAREHRERARDAFERALSTSRGFAGDGALELIAIRANLGLIADDRARGDDLLAEAEAARADRLGAVHPDTLAISWMRGTVTVEDLSRALAILIPVCRGYELHTALLERTASCWSEVARLRWELGDREAAVEAMERAHRASPHAVPLSEPYLMLWQGKAAAAAHEFNTQLARKPWPENGLWWERRPRAELLLGLGQAQRQSNQVAAARLALQTAVSELEEITRTHPSAFNERRLGRARVELALTLASLGATEREIAPIVASASRWLQAVHSPSHELALAALRRWE